MRLWRRASGVFKDQTSLWQASLSRRTGLRDPDIEKAVIRATSHNQSSFDRHNMDRVCEWLRLSPFNLKPILWSISNRMENTRSWVVALKGLHLMHIIINSRIPCVKKIGRLPFDLSNFSDAHARQAKTWPFNEFIRAYYAFLDQKSTVIFQHAEVKGSEEMLIRQELVVLQKLQGLVDLLMQIKPQSNAAYVPLVLHVMDGVIIEIYDLYSRTCRGIAIVLMNVYSSGRIEAKMALSVVQKATLQREDLACYFDFCHDIGVVNTSEFLVIDRIPDEGIQELKQIITSFSNQLKQVNKEKGTKELQKNINEVKNRYNDDLRTIITENWEKFDEDLEPKNPFEIIPVKSSKIQEPPDLINFV